jgi:hypothetical protein
MICARWGTKDANRIVARVICDLVFRAHLVGGDSELIGLRDLPAAMCLYWALAGAVERDDMTIVQMLLHAQAKDKDNKKKSLVVVLPLLALDFNSWKKLSGLENRRLPGSDLLFNFFENEASCIAIDKERAKDLFDDVELLISLEYLHLRPSNLHTWTPVGRYVWRRDFSDILGGFDDLPADHPILHSGLLGGTQQTAKKTVEKLRLFLAERPDLTW